MQNVKKIEATELTCEQDAREQIIKNSEKHKTTRKRNRRKTFKIWVKKEMEECIV